MSQSQAQKQDIMLEFKVYIYIGSYLKSQSQVLITTTCHGSIQVLWKAQWVLLRVVFV